MRGFNCYYYNGTQEKRELDRNYNISCWAGIKIKYGSTHLVNTIYIDEFNDDLTKEYQELLISIINEITPCEIIKEKNVELIKIKLLKTYDQCLIILSFIRYLWCNYGKFNNILFFETLKNDTTYTEPLERLTHANILASASCSGYYGDHSNSVKPSDGKIKNTKQLLEYKGLSTQKFLKSE